MESVLGALLESSGKTVACYEDLSGGSVASALGDAAGPLFIHGMTVNSNAALENYARAGGEEPPFANGAKNGPPRSPAPPGSSPAPTSAYPPTASPRVTNARKTWAAAKRSSPSPASPASFRDTSGRLAEAALIAGAPRLSVLSLLRRELLGLPAS